MTNEKSLREKFASLISVAHLNGLSDEYITHCILYSPYFDCFELNNVNKFLDDSFEYILSTVFRLEIVRNYRELSSEHYWAGSMIFSIMINTLTPLKRIALLYPLKDMIKDFYVYHEMNEIELIKRYLEIEQNKSILKEALEERHLSYSFLETMSNIPFITLRNLSKNENLYKTNGNNISNLSSCLSLSSSIFFKQSSFIVIDEETLQVPFIQESLKRQLSELYKFDIDNSIFYVDNTVNKEMLDQVKNNKTIIVISSISSYLFIPSKSNISKAKTIPLFVLSKLVKKALLEYNQSNKDRLFY